MVLRSISVVLLTVCLCLAAGAARAESNVDVLHVWLETFNGGDAAALRAFQQRYVGNSHVAFVLDTREETGGFDLVKIQTDTPTELSALLRQRTFPSTWKVTMTRKAANTLPFADFSYLPVPVSQSKALSALDAFADRLTAANEFSGVIAVGQHGKQVFAKAWGPADIIRNRSVTLNTPFLLASQGKMFTAVAVLQLIEHGRLSFDAPVGRYLSDYPNATVAREVTIRELLTHTDGLGDMHFLQDVGVTKSQHVVDPVKPDRAIDLFGPF